MSKDNPLYELKQIIKSKSVGIRTLRGVMKSTMRSGEYAGSLQFKLYFEEKPDIRAHHIAYCEIRGRTRLQIEQPAEGNEPNETHVIQIKAEYEPLFRAWMQKKLSEHSGVSECV